MAWRCRTAIPVENSFDCQYNNTGERTPLIGERQAIHYLRLEAGGRDERVSTSWRDRSPALDLFELPNWSSMAEGLAMFLQFQDLSTLKKFICCNQ